MEKIVRERLIGLLESCADALSNHALKNPLDQMLRDLKAERQANEEQIPVLEVKGNPPLVEEKGPVKAVPVNPTDPEERRGEIRDLGEHDQHKAEALKLA